MPMVALLPARGRASPLRLAPLIVPRTYLRDALPQVTVGTATWLSLDFDVAILADGLVVISVR